MGGNGTGGNGTGGNGTGGNGTGGNGTGGSGGSVSCTPGTTDFCYSGPPGTEIKGACKAGIATCGADGTFGPCIGEVTPVAEICTNVGDDDCDGQVNEDCACTANTTMPCYAGPMNTLDVGDCKAGIQTCNAQGTSYGPCIGEVLPVMENCSLAGDENCNGQINEAGAGCSCTPNTTQPCYTGPMGTQNVGNCKAGIQTCNGQGTAYGPCVGEVIPVMETCATPGDEDCDGMVNEGGTGCVCAPGTTSPCYNGPMGTQNVGQCKGGTQICNAQGTGYGACTGEVVPATETCATPGDEDCDGLANEGCTTSWTKTFGGTLDDDIYDVAVDSQGDVIVVGGFTGTVDFGGGPFTTPSSSSDIFVAKYSSAGAHLWSKQYSGIGVDRANAVAVDTLGNVLVTGIFQSTVDFGGAIHTSFSGTTDIFVLALDSAGMYLLSSAFGDAGTDQGESVAFDSASNAIVVGRIGSSVDFGGGFLPWNGSDDAFIVKFSSFGLHQWSRSFGDSMNQNFKDVATDAAGNVYVTGSFAGTTDFGGGAATSQGSVDAMLVKYSSAGNHVWTRLFAGTGSQNGNNISIDTQGNPVLAGQYQGVVDFGLGMQMSAGLSDIFVAKYTSNNALAWVRGFGDAASQVGWGIDLDTQNNVVFAGSMGGAIDFGGGTLTSAGGNDMYAVKLSSSGNHTWSRRGGDALEQLARAVATDSSNNAYVVGRFQGTVDFGSGPVVSNGGSDAFIAKYAP